MSYYVKNPFIRFQLAALTGLGQVTSFPPHPFLVLHTIPTFILCLFIADLPLRPYLLFLLELTFQYLSPLTGTANEGAYYISEVIFS